MNRKRWLRIILLLQLGLTVLCLSTFCMQYPSQYRLCRDVAEYIPQQECIALENNWAIVQRAFPEGEANSEQVKAALGKYLSYEGPTTYGHREVYHLSVGLSDYLPGVGYFDYYSFRYDHNGVLVAFSYDDF